MAGERGMDFCMGNVMEVGVVLAGKGFAESGRNQNARWEVWVPVDVETVARGERVGVYRVQAGGVGELGGFPVLERRWQGEVATECKRGEQRGRAIQNLREDLREVS